MGNRIATRKPSEEAIKLARACVNKAGEQQRKQSIESIGAENGRKSRELIEEIDKALQGKENEKQTVAKEEKGESR